MGSFIQKSKCSGFVIIVVELDARLAGRYGPSLLTLQAKFYGGVHKIQDKAQPATHIGGPSQKSPNKPRKTN